MWRTRSRLEERIRLLTESATATALKVNERDEHIRALTESATAMARKLEERESEIAALAKRLEKEITFDGRPPFPSDMMQIQFREWAVENEFPNLIPTLRQMYDNPLSYPESLGEFNGRTISRIFYCHARIVLAGITYANRPKRILEISGGYGEIARLWLTNSSAPADSYVIVDIPESLFFAEIALKG